MDKEYTHGSNSSIQSEIEEIIRKSRSLVDKFGVEFDKTVPNQTFEVDLYNKEEKIIGEIYCGLNPIKSGSVKKVIADCFKLLYVEKLLGGSCKKILVFIDKDVMNRFDPKNTTSPNQLNSWVKSAIKDYEIEPIFVEIPKTKMDELKEARAKQKVSNVKTSHALVGICN